MIYIGVAVALVFLAYFAALHFYMKKRKARQINEIKSRNSGKPLDDRQKRALAFGGVLFSNRCEKILIIVPEDSLDQYIGRLKSEWGIEDPTSAKEALENLVNLTRSKSIDAFIKESPGNARETQQEIAKELGIPLSSVEQTQSTFGWDTMRAVGLARWCYWEGHLTEQETWDFIHRAADLATALGRSWEDYTVSFLLGRTIHGFDLDDIVSMAKYVLNGKARGDQDTDIYLKYSYK